MSRRLLGTDRPQDRRADEGQLAQSHQDNRQQETRFAPAIEKVLEMLDDAAGAAVKKKRDGDVASICLIHLLNEMRQERVFVSFNQSLLIAMRDIHLERDNLP